MEQVRRTGVHPVGTMEPVPHPPRRVLVTGATGYVGRHVVTALVQRGPEQVEVIAVGRPGNTAGLDPRARVVEADVLAAELEVTDLLPSPPDAVIHLAWQDGFTHAAPSHIELLSAHYRFLRRLSEWGVPRLAVLGTMHEVGYWEGAIRADTPTDPTSLYGIAKDALRRAVFASLAVTTEVQWLRCYYIYGDDRRNRSVFARLLEAADEGRTTFPFTSGRNRYDFIHVEELGRQIAAVALEPGLTGVINCGSGEPVALGEMVERFILDHDLDIKLEYGAFPDRPYDSPGVWGDATVVRALMERSPG